MYHPIYARRLDSKAKVLSAENTSILISAWLFVQDRSLLEISASFAKMALYTFPIFKSSPLVMMYFLFITFFLPLFAQGLTLRIMPLGGKHSRECCVLTSWTDVVQIPSRQVIQGIQTYLAHHITAIGNTFPNFSVPMDIQSSSSALSAMEISRIIDMKANRGLGSAPSLPMQIERCLSDRMSCSFMPAPMILVSRRMQLNS